MIGDQDLAENIEILVKRLLLFSIIAFYMMKLLDKLL